MAEVSLADVRKSYGALNVIPGIDLLIADGEFVVLVGPSGCGKSTLLRMIAGLETITGGEVRIGPQVVNEMAPKDRDIAMVFQNYALYPHMTVAENMSFSLRLKKADPSHIDERIKVAADILGLGHLLDRFPRQLSGGQRQRVAMGRAIVRDPQVFLFDEPLSNLDAKLRVQMRTEIKELHQRLKTTTIFVTHDQVEAMTMADKIVVMHDGIIEQAGAPLQLYDYPRNMFVAGFIGSPSMNFIPGRITRSAGGVMLESDIGKFPISSDCTYEEDRAVTYGIRPEHIDIANEGLPAQVAVIEPTGAETQVVFRVGSANLVAVFRERHDFSPGQQVYLRPRATHGHLFDTATGERI